jgi:hypothetical protein
MSARDIANRFREQRYTPADVKSVINALEKGDAGFLRDVVASYIKYADNVDERALIRYLKATRDYLSASEIILGLSLLQCKDTDFTTEVLKCARGVAWDIDGYAQLSAVAALPRVLGGDPRVQGVLREAVRSSDVVIRNVALEAAQEFLGTPLAEVKRGWDDENFARKVPQEVREWLGLES